MFHKKRKKRFLRDVLSCYFESQEVSVKGQKVVYKDVIEPLESVSVTVIATEKEKLGEIGSPQEVRCLRTRSFCLEHRISERRQNVRKATAAPIVVTCQSLR